MRDDDLIADCDLSLWRGLQLPRVPRWTRLRSRRRLRWRRRKHLLFRAKETV